jgi:hypothetical protein
LFGRSVGVNDDDGVDACPSESVGPYSVFGHHDVPVRLYTITDLLRSILLHLTHHFLFSAHGFHGIYRPDHWS